MAACDKPSCARPGSVVLAYDYGARVAVLEDPPEGELSPHLYLLCGRCADRLNPPLGWSVDDRRETPPLFLPDASSTVDDRLTEPADPERDDGLVTQRLFFGETA